MDPKIIIIIVLSYVYGFFELFMNLRQRTKITVTKSDDKKSIWWLYGLITLGYALSFSIGSTKMGRIDAWNSLFLTGMGLFVFGFIVRIYTLSTLKQYFTYNVSKVENHKIIETGLYRYIRHPGYLGQMIIFLGIVIAVANWISILAMMVPVFIGYAYRIKVEEVFMLEQFGDDYARYQEQTKRIIPFVY